jgi:large subunit ribosomal protein L28
LPVSVPAIDYRLSLLRLGNGIMAKKCAFTGRSTKLGNQKTYRGKAKYLGGVGKKITGTSRRKFKANLQKVRAVVDGEVKRIWVSTAAIRSGYVQKPVKRQPFSMQSV